MRTSARRSIRLGIIAMAFIASSPLFAANAKGYVLAQCQNTGDYHLHFRQIDSKPLRREISLRIPDRFQWETEKGKWYEAPGEGCSSAKCEPAIHSKVQILSVTWARSLPFGRRRIDKLLGNFEIERSDGRTFTGAFEAKFLELPSSSHCD